MYVNYKNFAISTVATAPSPATSGTSLIVAAGHGTRFPAAPFWAVISPSTGDPDPSNAEVVRVTAKSTDTLTIVRAQQGSTARTVVVGDRIRHTVTAADVARLPVFVATEYGCVGDGATDNATPIAAMLAAVAAYAEDCEIYFPPGVYMHSQIFVYPANLVRLYGAGKDWTTIKATNNYNPTSVRHGSNMLEPGATGYDSVTIEDICFDHNAQGTPTPPGDVSTSHTLYLDFVARPNIRRVKVINNMRYAIFCNTPTEGEISGCHIICGATDPGDYDQKDGIHVNEPYGCNIFNNFVDNSGEGGDDCIAIQVSDGYGTQGNVNITNNHTAGLQNGVRLQITGATEGISNINISYNICDGMDGSGIFCDIVNTAGTGLFRNITIGNNTFNNCQIGNRTDIGVIHMGYAATTNRCDTITIGPNSFYDTVGASARAVKVQNATNVSISNQTIKDFSGVAAVELLSVANANLIGGSYDLTAGNTSVLYGIICTDVVDVDIGLVQMTGHTTGTTQGILVESEFWTTERVKIVGCTIRSFDTGILELETALNITDCRYDANQFTLVTTPYTLATGSQSRVDNKWTATATWDPPSLAANAIASTTVTVTGAGVEDQVQCTHTSIGAASWLLYGFVQAANTVRAVLVNHTGGTVNLGSGTLRVTVTKAPLLP